MSPTPRTARVAPQERSRVKVALPQKIGIAFAGTHVVGVLLTIWYVTASTDGQAPLVWATWAFVDLPWSLAYMAVGQFYTNWLLAYSSAHPIMAQLLYFPYILHGIVGTLWWYVLPVVIYRVGVAVRHR